MASTSTPAEPSFSGARRLWALVPLLLLVGVVTLFATSGTSLLDLSRSSVAGPSTLKGTIASSTVTLAIVSFCR